MNTPCPVRHICPVHLVIAISKTISKVVSEIKDTLKSLREINRNSSYEIDPR